MCRKHSPDLSIRGLKQQAEICQCSPSETVPSSALFRGPKHYHEPQLMRPVKLLHMAMVLSNDSWAFSPITNHKVGVGTLAGTRSTHTFGDLLTATLNPETLVL